MSHRGVRAAAVKACLVIYDDKSIYLAGSGVSVRQTTNLVVRGLGRAFLCLSVCIYLPRDSTRSVSLPNDEGGRGALDAS
eukprot:scaffold116873_cov66-Phaeocystis_antarctica.AAC.3